MRHYEQTVNECVGANIRMLREEQNLSLRKLGLMVGVDFTRLHAIERGSANPTINTLAKIALGLGVDISELFQGTNAVHEDGEGTQTPGQSGEDGKSCHAKRFVPLIYRIQSF